MTHLRRSTKIVRLSRGLLIIHVSTSTTPVCANLKFISRRLFFVRRLIRSACAYVRTPLRLQITDARVRINGDRKPSLRVNRRHELPARTSFAEVEQWWVFFFDEIQFLCGQIKGLKLPFFSGYFQITLVFLWWHLTDAESISHYRVLRIQVKRGNWSSFFFQGTRVFLPDAYRVSNYS